jgi:hypothetical protein
MKKIIPTAAPKNRGRPPTDTTEKKRLRPVYLTDEVWADLRATGNASFTISMLCEKAGYGKKSTP